MAEPTPDELRTCNTCGERKPLIDYYRNGSGYRAICKTCVCAALRSRYHEDPAHREASAARCAEYYRNNRASVIAAAAEYRKQNPYDAERERERRRAFNAAHPGLSTARGARWRAENIERARESDRAWAARRRAANLESARETGRHSRNRRRARMLGLPSEPYTITQLVERDGTTCVLCGEEMDFGAAHPELLSPTVEHLECISWPNSPGDVLSNVALAHFSCNSARHTKPHPAAARKRAELLAA